MKYAFVTLGIAMIWLSIILIILFLDYNKIILPIVGLIMTLLLFIIGIGGNK